ncbi:hypothetical protein P170DRAFT_475488 [Aspergillus steynii IBT 23096]|uniref:F-box domain-containing protein n=1 Tax=Aspergillus steynii IBT 23096 TaxID=1392250 RepID=A0A2I2G8G8_9EURO|nr:uncharacterized protein P170DRAFT_475488 [Aspergillus steynii IBT 23096]PLB49177.1 hypothetical protein P170DRAFT_475488 [Aspergillus steynii IBT 23096]
MDTLPAKLILHIAGFLKDEESHALHAFSQVSWRMYHLTAPLLYNTISIRFGEPSDLKEIADECSENGLGRPFLAHAMRLDIVALPWRAHLTDGNLPRTSGSWDRSITIEDFTPASVGSFMEPLMSHHGLPEYRPFRGEWLYYHEENCRPLVSVVSRLNKLKSMHYAMGNSFPRHLLDAVHQYHPTCEIHIWSPQTPRLDPGYNTGVPASMPDRQLDIEVLRSPCLRAIKLDLSDPIRDIDGVVPYLTQAPNLQHIFLSSNRDPGEEDVRNIPERTGDLPRLLSLQSFSLKWYFVENMVLPQTSQPIEISLHRGPGGYFSSSRHSGAAWPIDGDYAEVLTYRALGGFPRLQNLILDLYGNPRPVLSAEDGIFSDESGNIDDRLLHVSLKDAFINFATDQALATAIWTEIFSHQASRKLIRLRVSPSGLQMFRWEIQNVMLHLARSFLVTHGGTKVAEVGGEEQEARIKKFREYYQIRPSEFSRQITRLFHSIWPLTSTDTDWTTCWRSYPLQTNVD